MLEGLKLAPSSSSRCYSDMAMCSNMITVEVMREKKSGGKGNHLYLFITVKIEGNVDESLY
jgi:hypothetical protein